MVERVDNLWEMSEHLMIKDTGRLKKGAKTHLFIVHSRGNGVLLGTVRWYPQWRQYVFFPSENVLFDKKCLREVATYVEFKTEEYKAGVILPSVYGGWCKPAGESHPNRRSAIGGGVGLDSLTP